MFKNWYLSPGGLRDSLRLVWPLVLSMGSNALMQFVDRVFLSRYSDEAIQAVLPAGVMSFLIVGFFQAVVGYSGTFVAQFHGAGRPFGCARSLGQGVWLTWFALPLMMAIVPLAHWCFDCAGHPPAVIQMEKQYFDILMIGGFPICFSAAVCGYFSGIGRTRLVMYVNVFGNLLNILLDWLLVFGVGPFPEWGIAGAGWATVISLAAVAVLPLFWLPSGPGFTTWKRTRAALGADFRLMGKIVRFGVPTGLHVLLDMITFTVFIFITGRLSPLEFAVSNIVFAINHLAFAPLLGLSMGACILVGQFQGARNSAAAVRAGWTMLALGWTYMLVLAVFFIVAGEQLLMLFYGDESAFARGEYLGLGVKLLFLIVIWGFFDVVNLIGAGILKGAGDTRFVMIFTSSINVFVWVPMFLAVLKYCPTVVNLWITLPINLLMLAIGMIWRFKRGAWKNINLVQGEN